MARLVDAKTASARQSQLGQHTPPQVARRSARDAGFSHLRDKLPNVRNHQIQLVAATGLRRMDCQLAGREAEDQPASTDVDIREAEHIAQKRPVGVSIGAIDDCVSADHRGHVASVRNSSVRAPSIQSRAAPYAASSSFRWRRSLPELVFKVMKTIKKPTARIVGLEGRIT
jgi:hypothetical protein